MNVIASIVGVSSWEMTTWRYGCQTNETGSRLTGWSRDGVGHHTCLTFL